MAAGNETYDGFSVILAFNLQLAHFIESASQAGANPVFRVSSFL